MGNVVMLKPSSFSLDAILLYILLHRFKKVLKLFTLCFEEGLAELEVNLFPNS